MPEDTYEVAIRKKDGKKINLQVHESLVVVKGERGGFNIVPRWAQGKKKPLGQETGR
jgi:hypothetical protein